LGARQVVIESGDAQEAVGMPRGDRSGPEGMGPMTGRGMGYCAGFDGPGYVMPGGGGGRRGRGAGGGWPGRGLRHRRGAGYGAWGPGAGPYAPGYPSPYAPAYPMPNASAGPGRVDEAEALKAQAEYLEGVLKDVQRRLGELAKED
jgi:hypothetical protein